MNGLSSVLDGISSVEVRTGLKWTCRDSFVLGGFVNASCTRSASDMFSSEVPADSEYRITGSAAELQCIIGGNGGARGGI